MKSIEQIVENIMEDITFELDGKIINAIDAELHSTDVPNVNLNQLFKLLKLSLINYTKNIRYNDIFVED